MATPTQDTSVWTRLVNLARLIEAAPASPYQLNPDNQLLIVADGVPRRIGIMQLSEMLTRYWIDSIQRKPEAAKVLFDLIKIWLPENTGGGGGGGGGGIDAVSNEDFAAYADAKNTQIVNIQDGINQAISTAISGLQDNVDTATNSLNDVLGNQIANLANNMANLPTGGGGGGGGGGGAWLPQLFRAVLGLVGNAYCRC